MRLSKISELGRHWNVIQTLHVSMSGLFLVCKPFSFMCFKMFVYCKSEIFCSNDSKMHPNWLKEVHQPSCPFPQQETRVCATVCPASMEATAHCGKCDFNATTHICTVTRGLFNPMGRVAMDGLCSSTEEVVHSGDATTRSFLGKICGALCPWLSRPSVRLLLMQTLFLPDNPLHVNPSHHTFRLICCMVTGDIIWMHSDPVI